MDDLTDEQRTRREKAIRAVHIFGKFGLPGMTLQANPNWPAAKPRSSGCRCGCGRPISSTRPRCLACKQVLLMELGQQIETQELLEAVLRRNPDITREELRPHLKPELQA